MIKKENNYAFIDGQNLYLEIKKDKWYVDYKKFRTYLQNKYNVKKVFYFLGYYQIENENIYQKLQNADYVLIFKEHQIELKSGKKGNVDSNLIFEILKKIFSREDFDQIILVSGDGDYKKLVNYLINRKKFNKILFPTQGCASSLYKKLGNQYFDYLDKEGIKDKISFN